MAKYSLAKIIRRRAQFMPGGVPRYVRIYDDHDGDRDDPVDRYTVIFSGRTPVLRAPGCASEFPYLAMSSRPTHPQGVGSHGYTQHYPADCHGPGGEYRWFPAIGRTCHLGRRIEWEDLPAECQAVVLAEYEEIWNCALPEPRWEVVTLSLRNQIRYVVADNNGDFDCSYAEHYDAEEVAAARNARDRGEHLPPKPQRKRVSKARSRELRSITLD